MAKLRQPMRSMAAMKGSFLELRPTGAGSAEEVREEDGRTGDDGFDEVGTEPGEQRKLARGRDRSSCLPASSTRGASSRLV